MQHNTVQCRALNGNQCYRDLPYLVRQLKNRADEGSTVEESIIVVDPGKEIIQDSIENLDDTLPPPLSKF